MKIDSFALKINHLKKENDPDRKTKSVGKIKGELKNYCL
jgi:hypothetical protein